MHLSNFRSDIHLVVMPETVDAETRVDAGDADDAGLSISMTRGVERQPVVVVVCR